jgi:hypothetical protein
MGHAKTVDMTGIFKLITSSPAQSARACDQHLYGHDEKRSG